METRVVLDANVYIEANYGRSGKFSSLLDFLKRSASQLVVFPSILEEILAKHGRDFREFVDAANSWVKKVRQHSFEERLMLLRETVDFAKEREAVKQCILRAGKGVAVDYAEGILVDHLEIVRRGANRIPPASSNGEELRDVIHWLTVLSYAKVQPNTKILFVSRDNGFWSKEGGPRDQILQDIKNTGRDIQLFMDIEDLLRQNSLSSAELDPKRGAQLFDLSQLEGAIVARVGGRLNSVEVEDHAVEFKSGKVVSSEFRKGITYQVSADSEFVEGTFRLKIENEIVFKRKPPLWGSMLGGTGSRLTLSSLVPVADEPVVRFTTFAIADLSLRVTEQGPGIAALERLSLEIPGDDQMPTNIAL